MEVYKMLRDFIYHNPGVIAWRLKRHAEVIEKHLNPGEEIEYIFAGQRTMSFLDIFSTCVVAITNKRLLIAQKRLLPGYTLISVTPDMYNDLTARQGIIWGIIQIETVKELIVISKLSKKALQEVETKITEYMIREKKKYMKKDEEDSLEEKENI